MEEKPVLKIGHLRITDHLILGVTKTKINKGVEIFRNSTIVTVPMTGWNRIGEALTAGEIDIAFMLAPYAMELFHSGNKDQAYTFKPQIRKHNSFKQPRECR